MGPDKYVRTFRFVSVHPKANAVESARKGEKNENRTVQDEIISQMVASNAGQQTFLFEIRLNSIPFHISNACSQALYCHAVNKKDRLEIVQTAMLEKNLLISRLQ
ncbi:hypothetical protein Trydic_g101 [Trypoxylus dichotomus]